MGGEIVLWLQEAVEVTLDGKGYLIALVEASFYSKDHGILSWRIEAMTNCNFQKKKN